MKADIYASIYLMNMLQIKETEAMNYIFYFYDLVEETKDFSPSLFSSCFFVIHNAQCCGKYKMTKLKFEISKKKSYQGLEF